MNGSGDRAVFLCQFHFSGFKLNFKAELNSQIHGFLMRVWDTPNIGRECDSRFRGFGTINHNTVPQDQVPALESLAIIKFPNSHISLPTQSFPPSLHRLFLVGSADIVSTQHLGTLQLTHLTIHHRSREGPELFRILKECSQLTSCDLSLPCGTIDKRLVVTLLCLQERYFLEVISSADFLTRLTLPVLRGLKFKTRRVLMIHCWLFYHTSSSQGLN